MLTLLKHKKTNTKKKHLVGTLFGFVAHCYIINGTQPINFI